MRNLFALLFLITTISPSLYAHPDRTDSKNSHLNRKTTIYHYHDSGRSSSSALPAVRPIKITEKHWQTAINKNLFKGNLEVTVPAGRADIITDTLAIEVNRVSQYKEGIWQALKYAQEADKKPALVLYIDGQWNGYELYQAAEKLCKINGVSLFLANSYVNVNDLITLTKIPNKQTAERFINEWVMDIAAEAEAKEKGTGWNMALKKLNDPAEVNKLIKEYGLKLSDIGNVIKDLETQATFKNAGEVLKSTRAQEDKIGLIWDAIRNGQFKAIDIKPVSTTREKVQLSDKTAPTLELVKEADLAKKESNKVSVNNSENLSENEPKTP